MALVPVAVIANTPVPASGRTFAGIDLRPYATAVDTNGNRYTARNPEDFYEILHRYTDETMRVRTNTGYEARIYLGERPWGEGGTNTFRIQVGTHIGAFDRNIQNFTNNANPGLKHLSKGKKMANECEKC